MKQFNTFAEAQKAWQNDRERLASIGIVLPGVVAYATPGMKRDFGVAMDALAPRFGMKFRLGQDAMPSIMTDPNSAIPAMLSTLIDPEIIEIVFAPNEAANVFGEQKKGDWLTETAMFPLTESTGEVSSYGDHSDSGSVGQNINWPQRQNYRFQTIKQYGDLEVERAGLGKINWVSGIDRATALAMSKFENLTYLFGVAGLQNYGATNDPGLTAPLTPYTKVYGGTKWRVNGVTVATANEIYLDITTLFGQLVAQTVGNVKKNDKMKLVMSPDSQVALTATNSFNVNVEDLLKKNFPSMTVETIPQFGALSASNPQGIAAGELVQLKAERVEGYEPSYCSFSEKMRAFPIVRGLSETKQKVSGGSWGAIIRVPAGIAQMLGV